MDAHQRPIFEAIDGAPAQLRIITGGSHCGFIDDPSDKSFFRGVVANFLLESIYFYNGFAFNTGIIAFVIAVLALMWLQRGRRLTFAGED